MKERWEEFVKLTALNKQKQIDFLLSFIEDENLAARFEGYMTAAEQEHFAGEDVN